MYISAIFVEISTKINRKTYEKNNQNRRKYRNCKQVHGAVVEAHIHPRYKNLYLFQYGGEWCVCSEYAFKPLEGKKIAIRLPV